MCGVVALEDGIGEEVGVHELYMWYTCRRPVDTVYIHTTCALVRVATYMLCELHVLHVWPHVVNYIHVPHIYLKFKKTIIYFFFKFGGR